MNSDVDTRRLPSQDSVYLFFCAQKRMEQVQIHNLSAVNKIDRNLSPFPLRILYEVGFPLRSLSIPIHTKCWINTFDALLLAANGNEQRVWNKCAYNIRPNGEWIKRKRIESSIYSMFIKENRIRISLGSTAGVYVRFILVLDKKIMVLLTTYCFLLCSFNTCIRIRCDGNWFI